VNGQTDKVFIEDIREGEEIASPFLLGDLRLGQTRNGKPFATLKLQDRTGTIDGRVWDRAEEFFQSFKAGDVLIIRGVADSFNNQVQIKVGGWQRLDLAEVDQSHFLPTSPYDVETMFAELRGILTGMSDPHLGGLVRDFLDDGDLMAEFKRAPAAKRFHHAYIGGLLEHTLSIVRSVVAVHPLYPNLNRDLLLAGALLHDIGKVREFDQGLAGDYTHEGRLLGHILIGLGMVEDKIAARPDFPRETAILLEHLVVSHHGENELGSPKKPKILEGLALHLLDDLDAKMNGIGGFIQRHADAETGWTDYNRLLERFFYRPDWPVYEPAPPAEPPAEPPVVEAGESAAESSVEPAEESAPVEAPVEEGVEPAAEAEDRPEPESPAEREVKRDQLSFLEE
jgi:3'-5' exoribonuclease